MPTSWPRLLTAALIAFPVLTALVLGHEGTRLFQMLALTLTAWLWLWRPHGHGALRGVQAGVVAVLGLAFILDGLVRHYLMTAYSASPSSALVVTALANTNGQESREFMAMYSAHMLARVALIVALFALMGTGLWRWWRHPVRPGRVSRWELAVLVGLLAVLAVALASKPWRRHHPLLFWPGWSQEVRALRSQWSNLSEERQRLKAQARAQNPTPTAASPDTLVLVISESLNRDHFSLYGYPRDTTPELVARQQAQPERLRAFRHAWSVDASTVPALQSFFYFGQTQGHRQHVLALASAAGYRTAWISNHDDLAIEQEHAQLTDHQRMLNKVPGRSSQSLDMATLPVLEQALRDPAPRKLIVLHLIGAHPDYKLRYEPDQAAFRNAEDAVSQALKAQGRSAWVRSMRNEYDSAIRYHDKVVAASLDLTRRLGGKAVWVFLSDHGQDVGMDSDRAGHSMTTPAGYRIPLLMWGQALEPLPPDAALRPVRADWLGHSVMDLLGIRWPGHQPDRNVLDPRYRWFTPALPFTRDFAS